MSLAVPPATEFPVLAQEATDLFEGARERIAAFVGDAYETTLFTKNATEAINLVA